MVPAKSRHFFESQRINEQSLRKGGVASSQTRFTRLQRTRVDATVEILTCTIIITIIIIIVVSRVHASEKEFAYSFEREGVHRRCTKQSLPLPSPRMNTREFKGKRGGCGNLQYSTRPTRTFKNPSGVRGGDRNRTISRSFPTPFSNFPFWKISRNRNCFSFENKSLE